jgi:hypothetical protein
LSPAAFAQSANRLPNACADLNGLPCSLSKNVKASVRGIASSAACNSGSMLSFLFVVLLVLLGRLVNFQNCRFRRCSKR